MITLIQATAGAALWVLSLAFAWHIHRKGTV